MLDELLAATDAELAAIASRLVQDTRAQSPLSQRERALALLSALMGCGGTEAFCALLTDELDGGLAPEAAHEAALQATAYLGIGRVLPFVRMTAKTLAERGCMPPAQAVAGDRTARGEGAQVAIFGEGMRGFHASGDALARPVNALLSANCFGDYYVREGLTLQERELVTFCLLAAQGGCEAQLAGHIAGNFRMGNDAAKLAGAVLAILPFIGYPRSLNALACVRNAERSS